LGDTILFLATNGICRAYRGEIERLDIEIDLDDTKTYNSAINQSKYYLDLGENVLVIEKFSDSFNFIDKESSGAIWESHSFSLHSASTLQHAIVRQSLRQIRLKTNKDIVLVASNELREQRIAVKSGTRHVNLNLKGQSFKIRIEATYDGTEVRDLVAVVGF